MPPRRRPPLRHLPTRRRKRRRCSPDNSKIGGDTAALPAIWENKADFEARLAKFGTAAKEAEGKVKDLDGLKATWAGFAKDNCGGCHEKYRAKKS